MKATPDELKHYAQIYTKCVCDEKCPYYGCGNCVGTMMTDALAYIEQLESRAEPKNRVLTLEEIRNAEKDTFDIAIHWLELKFEPYKYEGKETTCAIFAVSMYFDDESDDVLYSSADMPDYYLRKKEYGKKWRCWLRKPAEEEMKGTPWVGDGRD